MSSEQEDVSSREKQTPFLTSSRLAFRRLTEVALVDFFYLVKEPGPLAMMGFTQPNDIVATECVLNELRDKGYYGICLGDELIGFIGFAEESLEGGVNPAERRIELMLARPYWHQGYGTEALRALTDFGFGLGYEVIWARVGDFNPYAAKALRSAGYEFLDQMPDTIHKDVASAKYLQRYRITCARRKEDPSKSSTKTMNREEKTMANELEPITIEITEDQTVVMEINGVEHVLYEGKPRKRVAPKPVPAPAPAPVVVPAPAPAKAAVPAPKRPSPIRRPVRTKPYKPTRKLASFGPGLTDDGQHSIHTVSFDDKVAAAPKDIREKYKALSAYLIDTYGCSHRVSFGYDSYRVGKKVVIALSLGGVHLRINAAIEPKAYDGTKMKVNDDTNNKKYAGMPSYIKVISDKTFKQSFRLIDDTMKALGVKKKKAN
ncbi:MAG: GNAT family N-acetyltransferase [Bacilli bacterium]|nr:GNAT family N-acetyltransferase [Bacilli bacterium]